MKSIPDSVGILYPIKSPLYFMGPPMALYHTLSNEKAKSDSESLSEIALYKRVPLSGI